MDGVVKGKQKLYKISTKISYKLDVFKNIV
jgi:hypothetical protein